MAAVEANVSMSASSSIWGNQAREIRRCRTTRVRCADGYAASISQGLSVILMHWMTKVPIHNDSSTYHIAVFTRVQYEQEYKFANIGSKQDNEFVIFVSSIYGQKSQR